MLAGALSVKCAAVQGGAGASLDFVNSSKFIKSQVKYNINVKVTNQKLVAHDVTEFTPIPNVTASKFNEVYGDCFISGFLEGGVLNALIMKEAEDHNDISIISGKMSVEADLAGGAVSVGGEAGGGNENEKKTSNVKTTIE